MAQIFDRNKALIVVQGDENLLEELIDLFKGESQRFLADVKEAVRAGEAEWLQRAARNIKGSLANLGAMAACETAMKLESMGANNDMKQSDAMCEKLVAEVSEFEFETEKYRGINTPSQS
ncbi:MAG: Hpt domain-containing protein [Candidatus Zixiibacteriota bacterium]|nr:MAG: Hpt domain-containing protein [candidate division Zixibacteria bacterium]